MNKYVLLSLICLLAVMAACGGKAFSIPDYDYKIVIGEAVRDDDGDDKESHKVVEIYLPGKNEDLVRFFFSTRVLSGHGSIKGGLNTIGDIKAALEHTNPGNLVEVTGESGGSGFSVNMVKRFINAFRYIEDSGVCKVMKRYHMVIQGEYLSKIAGRYTNVTVAQIMRANKLRSDRIHPGQLLEIPRNEEYKTKTICVDNDILKKYLDANVTVTKIADIKKNLLSDWNEFKKKIRGSRHRAIAAKLIERGELELDRSRNSTGKAFIHRTFNRIDGAAIALDKLMKKGKRLMDSRKKTGGRGKLDTILTILFYAFLLMLAGIAAPEAARFIKSKRKS